MSEDGFSEGLHSDFIESDVVVRKEYIAVALLIGSVKKLRKIAVYVTCFAMLLAGTWGSVWVSSANAVGSERAGEIVNERAANEVDRMVGEGTSDKIEGAVDGAVGTLKRKASDVGDLNVDKAARKLDGAADEAKGKVKRDVGRAKAAAAEANDDLEEASEGIVESIKEFFD